MILIVLDASAAVDLLLRNEAGEWVRERVTGSELHTVAHVDAEVFSALARLHRTGEIATEAVGARLRLLASLDARRAPIDAGLLAQAWAMRENIAARDALYVALARVLGARLLTTDQRLARAVPELVM